MIIAFAHYTISITTAATTNNKNPNLKNKEISKGKQSTHIQHPGSEVQLRFDLREKKGKGRYKDI